MIVTLSGRSGVGKTALVKRLTRHFFSSRILTSLTTRAPRPTDNPGEYDYVNREVFERKTLDGDFLWTQEVAGHLYGTCRVDLAHGTRRSSAMVLLTPTYDKAIFLHGLCVAEGVANRLISFYLLSPPAGVLRSRMRKRGDTAEAIEQRIKQDADWDACAERSGHPFVFIHDRDGDIQEKFQHILSYLEPCLSLNPPP